MTPAQDVILVVDDRAANRYGIVHALKRAGYAVLEAESGREALEMAKQGPSAILLDVKLPDILGYEVCRRLKSNPRTSHIPVLQLSAAFLDNESRVYALESGADAYLTQPVEPNVLIATVRSLVKLHEAESLAKLAARQWQATFDALSEGVAVVDPKGVIQRCNRAMTHLVGMTYVEIEGLTVSDLLDRAFNFKLSENVMAEPFEISTGSRFVKMRLEAVYVDGSITGSIFVLADITHQKLAERAALINERLAATGRMAHTIAHEINNPLAAITNLLYLLHESVTGVEGASYLRSAEDEVGRVSRISRQILSFHRESAARVEVNLSSLLDDVLALNNRELADRNIKIDKQWDQSAVVHGFPAQLRQVFSNIVRNAIEASHEESTVVIRISQQTLNYRSKRPGVRITVCDQGLGIPRENLHRIFDAFFTTKELKGTGVGLWLSSTIVQEHHGKLQVRSSVRPHHSGTCMSVLLPRDAPDTD